MRTAPARVCQRSSRNRTFCGSSPVISRSCARGRSIPSRRAAATAFSVSRNVGTHVVATEFRNPGHGEGVAVRDPRRKRDLHVGLDADLSAAGVLPREDRRNAGVEPKPFLVNEQEPDIGEPEHGVPIHGKGHAVAGELHQTQDLAQGELPHRVHGGVELQEEFCVLERPLHGAGEDGPPQERLDPAVGEGGQLLPALGAQMDLLLLPPGKPKRFQRHHRGAQTEGTGLAGEEFAELRVQVSRRPLADRSGAGKEIAGIAEKGVQRRGQGHGQPRWAVGVAALVGRNLRSRDELVRSQTGVPRSRRQNGVELHTGGFPAIDQQQTVLEVQDSVPELRVLEFALEEPSQSPLVRGTQQVDRGEHHAIDLVHHVHDPLLRLPAGEKITQVGYQVVFIVGGVHRPAVVAVQGKERVVVEFQQVVDQPFVGSAHVSSQCSMW